jgi:hypothetical protein
MLLWTERGVELVGTVWRVHYYCKPHVDFADCVRIGISTADEHVGSVDYMYAC